MEAKFRGRFSQVQQVKLLNKKLEHRTVVFLDMHNKLAKVLYFLPKAQSACISRNLNSQPSAIERHRTFDFYKIFIWTRNPVLKSNQYWTRALHQTSIHRANYSPSLSVTGNKLNIRLKSLSVRLLVL